MATNRSANEIKQHYVDIMGQDLGSVFYALCCEHVWQYAKWNEYQELFGTKPSRIDLVNKVSPLFLKLFKILCGMIRFFILPV